MVAVAMMATLKKYIVGFGACWLVEEEVGIMRGD
jgi:hypothetical protein